MPPARKLKIAFPRKNVVNTGPYRNQVPVLFRARGWDHFCLSVYTPSNTRIGVLDVPAAAGAEAQWYAVRVPITATVATETVCTLFVCPMLVTTVCNPSPTAPPTGGNCKRRQVKILRP
jgi:hypothetical protein